MADHLSEFIPLSERAVRRDGTISLKIIQPGWGSSGYYGRDVLERDIPKVFPAGTKMFWNHATASEEMERPEGDLRNLAAVTVSDPVWFDGGPNGPGMYAEARPFAGYAGVIDEIGQHIGVSIRGRGSHTTGTVEGKNGRIITEIVDGKSVDFVTEPGAGGAIVSIFESAPNAAPLPSPIPGIDAFLVEAGRVLSKANETKLKAALEQLTAVLSLLDSGEESDVSEAGDDVRTQTHPTEDAMSEQALQEARDALEAANAAKATAEAELAKMKGQLVLGEAKDFVTAQLTEAELPDVTKGRLAKSLASNPPVKEGTLDTETLKTRVETAVSEARAEIATLLGKDGNVTGNGGPTGDGKQPTIEGARTRLNESLAKIGYGGSNGN